MVGTQEIPFLLSRWEHFRAQKENKTWYHPHPRAYQDKMQVCEMVTKNTVHSGLTRCLIHSRAAVCPRAKCIQRAWGRGMRVQQAQARPGSRRTDRNRDTAKKRRISQRKRKHPDQGKERQSPGDEERQAESCLAQRQEKWGWLGVNMGLREATYVAGWTVFTSHGSVLNREAR